MKALTYNGKGGFDLVDKPIPEIQEPTDAIVKILYTTICGTDLHILKGDVPDCKPGTTIGHEGVGVVETPGPAVTRFKEGDHVLISCISSCAVCSYCRKGMYSHCEKGGWILGNTTDGLQAEYARIPVADNSLFHIVPGADEKALVMLSDIFPTSYECGVLNGKVQPGSTVAIIGAGPIGLGALMGSQLYSASMIIMIDMDPNRLSIAKKLGATHTLQTGSVDILAEVMKLTDGLGVDTVMEAVGVPQTLELAQDLVTAGGTIANVGVHGKPCTLKIDKLWIQNITMTAALVDTRTTPTLLKMVESGRLRARDLITHEFKFSDMAKAYSTFGAAAQNNALKVVIEM